MVPANRCRTVLAVIGLPHIAHWSSSGTSGSSGWPARSTTSGSGSITAPWATARDGEPEQCDAQHHLARACRIIVRLLELGHRPALPHKVDQQAIKIGSTDVIQGLTEPRAPLNDLVDQRRRAWHRVGDHHRSAKIGHRRAALASEPFEIVLELPAGLHQDRREERWLARRVPREGIDHAGAVAGTGLVEVGTISTISSGSPFRANEISIVALAFPRGPAARGQRQNG